MAWLTKGSGRSYKWHLDLDSVLELTQKKSSIPKSITESAEDVMFLNAWTKKEKKRTHDYVKIWGGSSKAMGPGAIFNIVINAPKIRYLLCAIISDDDSTMKAQLSHTEICKMQKTKESFLHELLSLPF